MKIEGIRCFYSEKLLIIQIISDTGLSGWGECSAMQVNGSLALLKSALARDLIGQDIFNAAEIERRCLRQHYKYSGQLLAMTFSGIDMALWDLRGKAVGLPLYALFGGKCRDSVPMYASSMTRNLSIQQECEKIAHAVREGGFGCVKIKIGPRMGTQEILDIRSDIQKVRAVRETIGEARELMVDANSAYTAAQAVQLHKLLEPYRILVYEEPCSYEDLEAYEFVSKRITTPVNWGEQNRNLYTLRDFLLRGAVQVVAFDATKCGGLTQLLRAETLCRAFNVNLAPHNTSVGLGTAAHLQVIAASPQATGFQEFNIEVPKAFYLKKPFQVTQGRLTVPNEPGLGVEIDEDALYANTSVTYFSHS